MIPFDFKEQNPSKAQIIWYGPIAARDLQVFCLELFLLQTLINIQMLIFVKFKMIKAFF